VVEPLGKLRRTFGFLRAQVIFQSRIEMPSLLLKARSGLVLPRLHQPLQLGIDLHFFGIGAASASFDKKDDNSQDSQATCH
jgi:hypothetical protein